MSTLLLIVVLLVVFGGLPQVSGHNYGYGPSGLGGIIDRKNLDRASGLSPGVPGPADDESASKYAFG